jgi:ABC-2 type transport system ATP-binding protein
MILTKLGTLIKAKGLRKSFGSNFGLGPLDITLLRGEVLGLVGVNASGKTTILRLLTGDILPDDGQIEYPAFGHVDKVRDWPSVKGRIARVVQGSTQWPGQVLSNLQFVASSYATHGANWEEDLDRLLIRYELDQYRNYKWSDISGGFRTRFEIVRALLSNPDILILDEPLAYLDIISQQVVLSDLRAIAASQKRPIGVVLSSQQLYEIESMSDRLIVIDNGAVKFSNTIDKLQSPIRHTLMEVKIIGVTLRDVESALAEIRLIDITPSEMGIIGRFHIEVTAQQVTKTLSEAFGQRLTYLRDISRSCGRFFDIGLKPDE